MNLKLVLVGSFAAFSGFASAQTQDVGQHPAVFSPRQLPGLDASTFIVGHPAGPEGQRRHANHEHPALATWAAAPSLDIGRYLVQPPASMRWTEPAPAGAATLAQVPVIVR